MPPKAKAKAKAKADPKDAAKEAPKMEVPHPPPAPTCLPIPEPHASKYAAERRLLLAWADPLEQYKVQVQPYTPGQRCPEGEWDESWADVGKLEKVPMAHRAAPGPEARLVPCEHVRLRYRLAAIPLPKLIDGKYAATWFSTPSEPLASFVDPPVDLKAELVHDDCRPFVALSWQSSNMGWLRRAMSGEDGQMPPTDPFEAWPGLLPVKVQVRWRPARALRDDGSLPEEALPEEVVSPAVDNVAEGGAAFDMEDETWRLEYHEALQGVAARFSVRVGTCYRWSPWSDETEEVEVEIPEPKLIPTVDEETGQANDAIVLKDLSDRQVRISWAAFSATGTSSEAESSPTEEPGQVEYRVMACLLEGGADAPDWDGRGFVVATLRKPGSGELSTTVGGLHPNTWYVVRVDARHAFVGKRAFSTSKALSAPFRTAFPGRPPLQPLPVDTDPAIFAVVASPRGAEVGLGSPVAGGASPTGASSPHEAGATSDAEQEDAQESMKQRERYNWEALPWVALRLESGFMPDYDIEFKGAGAAGEHVGGEHFESWRRVEDIQVGSALPRAGSRASVSRPGSPAQECTAWQTVRVGLGADAPESVVCRLVSKARLSDISPLQWSVASPPLVPMVAPACFSGPTIWGHVGDASFHFVLRFFLRPAATRAEEHAAVLSPWPSPYGDKRPLPGHRFVSRYQLRLRQSVEPAGAPASPWVTHEPRILPAPATSHAMPGSRAKNADDRSSSPTSKHPSVATDGKAEEDIVCCLGWHGKRFEVPVDVVSEVARGTLSACKSFLVELRVGCEHRWSDWASPFSTSEAPRLAPPVPEPLEGDDHLDCKPVSATWLSLSWRPFERLPGISAIEYVVRATPELGDGGEDSPFEGAKPVEQVVKAAHVVRQSVEQLLQTKEARRFLDQRHVVDVGALSQMSEAAKLQERQEEQERGTRVRSELAGLLPCTRYSVTVRGRYPATVAAGFGAGEERILTASVVTPGGAAPPAAPRAVLLGEVEDALGKTASKEALAVGGTEDHAREARSKAAKEAARKEAAREAFLGIEHQPGYVLEYRAASQEAAHFDSLSDAGRGQFGGSWTDSDGPWQQVARTAEVGWRNGLQLVRATLPPFGSQTFLPDAVEFRLRAAARGAAHPCRWAGGISEPIAACLAPPHRQPRLRHVLADDRWFMSLAVELFRAAPAPSPAVPLHQSAQDLDEEEAEEEHDRDMLELQRSHSVPVPPPASWLDPTGEDEIRTVPVGYGHRMVNMIQVRYSLQSALLPTLRKQLEDKVATRQWQELPPAHLGPEKLSGSRCTVEVGSDAGPSQGGIYMFQARFGDGRRWSAWSPATNAFGFRAPPPAPPPRAKSEAQVAVEIVSSTAARVRWGDFRPAPGLALLEYELQAVPQLSTGAGSATSAVFQHRFRGGLIEHEIGGLIPFTTYIFSVQARYPQVGLRQWAGRLESAPVTMEHSEVLPDPPVPVPVPDAADGSREAPPAEEACGIVEFPEEEEGCFYELEYALSMGSDADMELRINQSYWLAPSAVTPVEDDAASSVTVPRWRAHMPNVHRFCKEPLKQALLQQVRFRLRTAGSLAGAGAASRSSPSAAVSIGIAEPEAVDCEVAAAGDRLILRARFSLDSRLSDLLAAADPAELRTARADLQESLSASQHTARSAPRPPPAGVTLFDHAALREPRRAWPRGFGHGFVTRCQMRFRYCPAPGQWGTWCVCADTPLPREVGGDANSGGRPTAAAQDAATGRQFSADVVLPSDISLEEGQTVQVAVRLGDGIKWSGWNNCKELFIGLPQPRPAREQDCAVATWHGSSCVVRWPAAAAAPGLTSVEYRVMVHPDSDALPPRICKVLIGPAAAGKEGASIDATLERALGSAKAAVATAAEVERLLSVELDDLCKDVRYRFIVSARYPTVGVRTFCRLFQTEHVAWRAGDAAAELRQVGGQEGWRRAPPAVAQVAVPTDSDARLSRWADNGRGSLVLLTWPGLRAPTRGEPAAYEVQAAAESAQLGRRRSLGAALQATAQEWVQFAPSYLVLDGTPCAALRDLPFNVARFRLFDPISRRAGPASSAIPMAFEEVEDPPRLRMVALGKGAPRALGAEWRITLGADRYSPRWATVSQVQFKRIGSESGAGESGGEVWQQTDPMPLRIEGADEASDHSQEAVVLLREEDGLELGNVYQFKVRLGDSYRLGPWSMLSAPLSFSVPPPCAREDTGIRCQADETSATLCWEAFGPDQSLERRMPTFSQLAVKYTVSVFSGEEQQLVTRVDTQSTSIKVRSLTPGTAYSVSLAASWSRFDPFGSSLARPLMAAFVTGASSHLRGIGGSVAGGGSYPVRAAAASGSTRTLAGATGDALPSRLAPSPSTSPRARVAFPDEGARGESTASPKLDASGPTSARLPRIIPMPPPKFQARDPMTMAATLGPLEDRPSYARTPRPKFLKRALGKADDEPGGSLQG